MNEFALGDTQRQRDFPNVHMLFGLLFEFPDFRGEVLKIALEARVCLLYLYVVYR